MPAVTCWAAPAAPLAHGGAAAQAWTNLGLVTTLALVGAGYARGVHELWSRRGVGAVVGRWRVGCFALGVGAVLAASTGPVHELAARSFAGHMAQHMLLLVVAGPALAAAAVGLPLALAAPRRLRRYWARWRASTAGARLRRPGPVALLAGSLHGAVLWVWHLPAPYRLATENALLHLVEHASFVVAAALLWSVVLGAGRHRLDGPAAVLLLVGTMLVSSALGAALTLAPGPVYPVAILAPEGGDPLTAQQLAGLLMWIPMDVIVLAVAAVVFLRWFSGLDRRSPRAPAPFPDGSVGGSGDPDTAAIGRPELTEGPPVGPAAGKGTR
ncbi:cytochrome c oxidase assembly protein [Plantactinospora sp. WMMC1484]|uniref:cytochrome c oxidase assembly protein n=1 Tax=Plantactinospora sp. WMMC1484 TaxID=3404122 RepID=UPI003BF61E75